MKVDYLRDAPPRVVERIQSLGVLPQTRALMGFAATAILVTLVGWGVEGSHVHKEREAIQTLQLRVDRSTILAARVRNELDELAKWERLDRELRGLRDSGAVMSRRMASIARALPAPTWLTSMVLDGRGAQMEGHATRLRDVGATLASMSGSSLVELRAPVETRRHILAFGLNVPLR
jgi:hypothetical protein